MIQYIKKRKFKNNNRFKYVYYKIDGKTKKRISSEEYYKNKNKNKKYKYIGGNKYKGVSILKTEDNAPIHGSIKQITRVDKNLIEFLGKHDLDHLFKRDKDIIIHGVPYVSYKMSPNDLKKMEEKMEELQKDDKYDGPHIFRNRVTYSERNIHKDMYIWDIEGEENPDIDETQEEFDILSKKSIDGKGFNPLTNKRYSDKYLLKDKDGKMRMEYYLDLPLYIDRNHVRAVIENNQVTLIQSGTGSGKSVIVPKIALQIINYGYGYTADIEQRKSDIEQHGEDIEQQKADIEHRLKKNHKVIMTLPKRILTSIGAESSAKELDVTLGEEIGYKHKGSKIGDKPSFDQNKTILLYATDGTLESKLKEYPTLRDGSGVNLYDIIIIDEVHERNERIDMIIHMMKYALKHNPSLKLILMSATIDPTPFKVFFREFKFQDISISGKPLKTIYEKWIPVPPQKKKDQKIGNYQKVAENQIKSILENEIGELDDEDITNPEYERMKYIKGLYDNISNSDRENILHVQKQVERQEMSEKDRSQMQAKKDAEEKELKKQFDAMTPEEQKEYNEKNESQELNKKGAILFFDINTSRAKSMCNTITKFKDNLFLNTEIYCRGLDGKSTRKNPDLKKNVQDDTLYKKSEGGPYGRKVVIATNIAESSLTIKGLSYVIDSGYESGKYYNPEKMMEVMEIKRISKAQARQRWGRVGRTEPGMAIKLYTEEEYNNFEDYPEPALLTIDCMPLLIQITDMMEKKNKYSELLDMKYQNTYNIKSIEDLIVNSNDFFITPIKQNYFDSAKKILKELKCLDENGDLTLDFYLIREIFNILKENSDNTANFSIFDAKMILESFIYDCVDEVIEIIVCCKYLKNGSLENLFNPESDKQKKLRINKKDKRRIINKKKLYKDYKKFIDKESDHLTIYNLYNLYKKYQEEYKIKLNKKDFDTTEEYNKKLEDEEKKEWNKKNKKKEIMPDAFQKTSKFFKNFSFVKIFYENFEQKCKDFNKPFPELLKGFKLKQIDYNHFIDKFPDFLKTELLQTDQIYIQFISDVLMQMKNKIKEIEVIFKENNIIIDLEVPGQRELTKTDIERGIKLVLDKKYLPLKDKITLNLEQIFNQELQNDNNTVFRRINDILNAIKGENDNSMKIKVLYSLYLGKNEKNKEIKDYFQDETKEADVEDIHYVDTSTSTDFIQINEKKEIWKHHNDLKKNIKRCIVAGYSVHICQNKPKEKEGEQEGGGWWPFSFGKGKEDTTNENYINCFLTKKLELTSMFEENKDKTFVNFKNPNKKYIIYNTLSQDRNKPLKNYANIITIIPEDIIHDNVKFKGDSKCSVQERE